MTVETTLNRKTYAGNGVSTAFPTTFEFEDQVDLVVILKDNTTGVEAAKTLTTDYTVSGGNGNTGTVTMLVAPPTGTTLTLFNDPIITQTFNLVEGDVSPAESKEQAYDKLTYICQRLSDRMDRAIRLSEGFSAAFNLTLPLTLPANSTLVVNPTGDGFALGPDITAITNAAANAAAAAASATAAAASATAASGSQTAAAGSATAAATSATNAATSAASAAAAAATAVANALAASPAITTPAITGGTITGATLAHPGISDYAEYTEQAGNPAQPAAGKRRFYAKADGMYMEDSSGNVTKLGGGGGGSALIWRLTANAPDETTDTTGGVAVEFLDFNNLDSQEVEAQIQVPTSYVPGTKIVLKGGLFITPVTAGNVKFKSVATLLRGGTTVLGTYVQQNSSNAQVAVPGVANKFTAIGDVDLTDATGNVGGTAIQGGDTLHLKLIRDTAGETSGAAGLARLVRFGMVPQFT